MNQPLTAEIKHFAVHDGPGLRTTVFLKGCPLRCAWCHNPECLDAGATLLYRRNRCSHCGSCVAVCPCSAHVSLDGQHVFDRTRCRNCGVCVESCLSDALELCGKAWTPDDVVAAVMEDTVFYRESGGGVTLSGGEPLLYPEFCRILLDDLGARGVHRAVDTCGDVWQMAEYLGDATPHAVQRLLGPARWCADKLQGEVLRYAQEHLVTSKDPGVLIVDETGFLKKGEKSVAVQRQYSGTAGRIENRQIGVFLALATSRGRTLADRELYLPQGWCKDPARCRAAGIPEGKEFATKQRLAQKMLERAFQGGFSPAWVLAGEVYGSDGKFRRFLEERGQPYVLAVSSQQRLWVELRQKRVDTIAQELAPDQWFRLSAGEGMKGPRFYDWAAGAFGALTEDGLRRWVLFRRSVEKALFCSGWRRRHQAVARRCHYRRRGCNPRL